MDFHVKIHWKNGFNLYASSHIKLYILFFIIPPFEWIRRRWGIALPPHIRATELDLLSMFKITDFIKFITRYEVQKYRSLNTYGISYLCSYEKK